RQAAPVAPLHQRADSSPDPGIDELSKLLERKRQLCCRSPKPAIRARQVSDCGGRATALGLRHLRSERCTRGLPTRGNCKCGRAGFDADSPQEMTVDTFTAAPPFTALHALLQT
ncbi:MAG TPA: hypothetical protein VF111_06465, partial [Thermoanaerobaculia bacterium]